MSKDRGSSADTELRRQAEDSLRMRTAELQPPRSDEVTLRLFHELEVHQTELVIQNEELHHTRDDLETALEQYTDLYEFAPVGYVTLDPGGTIRRINLTGADLLGGERTRLVGSRLKFYVAEEDRLVFSDFLGKIYASSTNEVCEVAFTKKGGPPLYVQIKGVVAESELECRLVLIDSTERKLAEDRLRHNEVRYRALFDNSMDAIILSDSDGVASSANPEACTMFQMTEEKLCKVGRNGIMNLSDPRLETAVNMRAEFGKVRCELTAVREDGTIFPVEVSSVIFDDECHSFSVLRDITDQKQAEEDLREKDRLLVHQNRLAEMGEMISNIAHQWRQPLNTLGLSIQELKLIYEHGYLTRELLEQSVGRSMELIHHMSQTIDDFMKYFQKDLGKMEYKIRDALTRTVSLVEDSLKFNQIEIEVNATADPALVGLQNEYSQVLLNIIMNAKDALLLRHRGDARITITISKEGERSAVTIADNGGGIPEEIIGKVFDPYFTTKGPDQGTGLGLFMSKSIVEKSMGGHLTVRNRGDGAEFRIEV